MREKKRINQIVRMIFMLSLLFGVLLPAMVVNAASINKKKETILVSQKVSLKVNGTNKSAKWSTSNSKVAKVNQKGIVTGVKPGTAIISAKIGNETYICKVTVKIGISKSKLSLSVGENSVLKLYGTKIKNVKTSNKKIATVTKKGKVKGVAAGKAKITLTGTNGKKYTCTVTVKKTAVAKPISISIKKELAIEKKQSVKLTATITPGNAADKTVSWSSSDAKVATVKGGLVTGKGIGTAIITAKTSNGKTAQCKVTVGIKEAKTFDDFAKASADLVKDNSRPSDTSMAADDEFFAKRLIVQTKKDSISFDEYNPTAALKSIDNLYVLQFSTSSAAKKAFGKISSLSNIVYVEPDTYAETMDNGSAGSWGSSAISADTYAKYVSGNTKELIKVAVVDTGVSKHTYLSNRITNDGYDFVEGDSAPDDMNGHGTHVAGIITECTPGLNVKIMPVRVLNANGFGSSLNIANGIRYAADHGAKVLNLSLAGKHSITLDNSIAYAVQKGVVVVVAAGNGYGDTKDYCPAHLSDVIVVGAVDSNNSRSSFSNVGQSLDVVAPGVDIVSCWPGGSYKSMQGTSMAAPHVAAMAAMLKLMHPSYMPAQIEQLVKSSAKDLGSKGWDRYYGYGLPDLSKLIPVLAKEVTISGNKNSVNIGESLSLTATITPDNTTDKTITWSSNNTNVATVDGGRVTGRTAGTATITARSANGKTATYNVTVSKANIAVTGISMVSDTMMPVGDWADLEVIILPSDATDKKITWNSSDPSVATVSEGRVTTIAPGTTTITAKSANGITAECVISVFYPRIDLEVSIGVGETYTIQALKDSGGLLYNKPFYWHSTDTNVATVSEEGKVTGKREGKASVKAEYINGDAVLCRVTVFKTKSSVINDYKTLMADMKAKFPQSRFEYAIVQLNDNDFPDLLVRNLDSDLWIAALDGESKLEHDSSMQEPVVLGYYPKKSVVYIPSNEYEGVANYEVINDEGNYGINLHTSFESATYSAITNCRIHGLGNFSAGDFGTYTLTEFNSVLSKITDNVELVIPEMILYSEDSFDKYID